ncbi:MAG: glycine cleavage system protein GcvH [Anaerolineae bacterium]
MAEINGCYIPDDLYYWPEKHVWARPEDDGTVTIGITDVAQHLAKGIISVTPKKVGRKLKRGKSAGTLESGKWVGPVTTPISGELVAVNETLKTNPKLINEDPYDAGWFARIQPGDWETDKADLVTGAEGIEAYRQFLEAEGISCA